MFKIFIGANLGGLKMAGMRQLIYAVLFLSTIYLSGCGSAMMKDVKRLESPMPEKAMVTFVRPNTIGFMVKPDIWDGDSLVGFMATQCYIQHLTAPGKHLFLIRVPDNNWQFYIQADLEAGRHYFVEVLVHPFGLQAFPVTRTKDDVTAKTIEEWFLLKPIAVIEEQKTLFTKLHIDNVRKELAAFKNGNKEFQLMEKTDFRQ
jgi:hypothetical protein